MTDSQAAPGAVHGRPRLRTQVAYLFGSNALDRVLGLVGYIIVARYLGAAEFGRVGAALVLGALLARLTDLGVSITLQRDVARHPHAARELLARGLGFRVLSSAVGLLGAVAYALGTQGVTSRAWLPILAAAGALVAGWAQMFAALWLGALRSQYVAVAQAAYRLLYLALVGVVVLVGGGSNQVMLALLLAAIGQLLLGIRLTRQTLFVPRLHVSASASAALIRDSWPIGVSSFTVMAYDRVDTLVASWFLAAAVIGNYVAAYAFYSATLTVSNAINSVALSALSRHASDPRAALARFRRGGLLIFVLGTFIALALAGLASPITRTVYGGRYDLADSCLRVLAVAVPFLFANNLAGVTLMAIGKQRMTMMLTLAGLVFNVAANLLTVPVFGIYAAAWTTVATELAVAVGGVVMVETALRRPARVQPAVTG